MEGPFFAKEPVLATITDTVVKPLAMYEITVSTNGNEYKFKEEAVGGDIKIDVGSAFRAEYLKYDATPENATEEYTVLTGKLTVKFIQMTNGVLMETTEGIQYNEDLGTIYKGGRSDAQRLLGTTYRDDSHWTFKPNQDEVVGINEVYFMPGRTSSSRTNTENIPGVKPIAGCSVYVESNPLRRCFAFTNSFGLIESASAVMCESLSYKIESEQFNLVHPVGNVPSATIRNKNSGGRAQWKMSSGFNTREWLTWWATEFLMAERHWMLLPNGKWLPVTITPGDEVEIYDKAKGEMHAVNFTVVSAVEGRV